MMADAETHPPAPSVPIVGVGASAGGLEAFTELLRHLPRGTGRAFVLIQHLDPAHPSYLGEALAHASSYPVHEIVDGMRVEPDHVYVIPSGADVALLHGVLTLVPRSSDERRPHLPIDLFFRALAAEQQSDAIGVVLSGTGCDGADGVRAIKAEGGVTFVQEPGTAMFSGMPEAAIGTGAVDVCLPIPQLAAELARLARHPFLARRDIAEPDAGDDIAELRQMLALIRSVVGVDLGAYKLASVRRRLSRRMALKRATDLAEYLRLLRDDRAEVQSLFEDILVHVTSFFRDGDAFELLKKRAFPAIVDQKRGGGTIRIWSVGCSTGEEAYSIAIALLEFLATQDEPSPPIQIYGTDVSEKAIEHARAGFYPDGAIRDVSPERLQRYFTKVEAGGYRISRSVRELCAFVRHDLASDPPFSKLDLVCCRNVLIYLGPDLQKRVLATFHFALNEPGYLLLGRAESLAEGTDLFQLLDKEHKIYVRSSIKSTLRLTPARQFFRSSPPHVEPRPPTTADLVHRTERLLLDRYAPPGVIVNGRMEIVHFFGRTGPYLEPAPGEPQLHLLKMARKGLVADLRIGISQARKERRTVHRPGVRIEQDGSTSVCDLIVMPVPTSDVQEDAFAILFEEVPEAKAWPAEESATAAAASPSSMKLQDELRVTREYLQSIIEEHQRANEELLSTNEQLVTSNEELQSLNEELQTAKEELQSTNEELSTLNEEIQARNTELNSANSDLLNILASVEVPIVIVDGLRRIRRFTPRARAILNLLPTDVGRPIDDIKPTLAIDDLDQKIAGVIETVTPHDEEVPGRDERWHRIQVRPYMTVDKRIDGAVISVIDIDVLKQAVAAAEWARDCARVIVETVRVPLVMLTERLDLVSANAAFEEAYGVAPEAVKSLLGQPAIRSALERVRDTKESLHRLEVDCEQFGVGGRALALSGRAVPTTDQGAAILLSVEDVTARRQGEAERARLLDEVATAKTSAEEANRAKDRFLATLSHELRTPLATLHLSAQLLRMGNIDNTRLRKTADSIERAARGQEQLIDNLVDISRIVTGELTMELQAVDLAAVGEAAVEAIRPMAEIKQLDLQLDLDGSLPPLSGDPVRLRQVVSNLVSNAIKFTPERGRVRVSVDAVGDRARIRVTDTGAGIEPEFLAHLFDRFSQEEVAPTRRHGGLGLGLAIVRYIVEAHGGSVQAESAGRGKGSTFTVTLPR
jgi:two-component system CheB/CheR fusion protein